MSDDHAASLQPSASELEAMAVFPLPRIVLFPGTRLPLHIFEDRYRAMMGDCLQSGRTVMAMAQLRSRDDAAEAQPAIYEVAGAGRIESHRRNEDGTYDLHLLGVARVQLSELPLHKGGYRRARATLLSDRVAPSGLPRAAITGLFSLASQVAKLVQEREPRFRLLASPSEPDAQVVDKIADQFIGDPSMRQEVLELLDVAERLSFVAARLAHLHLALLTNDDTGGGPTFH